MSAPPNDSAPATPPRQVPPTGWRIALVLIAIIVGLAQRLTRRLRNADPIAGRVKLTKGDGIASTLAALRFLP